MTETIDVGPVYCPSCKREYGNTEAEALREALRIAVEGLVRIGEPHPEMRLSPVERTETAVAWLAAVRELVDLGGDDG